MPLTLGLSILVAVMETLYVRTGNEEYKRMTKFWGKLFIINFAMGLYPRVMVSGRNDAWSPYTLRVMSIVALIMVPVVLVYQGWSYWVFRQRVGREHVLEY